MSNQTILDGGPATGSAEPPDPGRPSRRPFRFSAFAGKYSMVGVLLALIIVATALYPGFVSPGNVGNILSQNSAVGIIAVGMTFVIITGGFDLSVGAIYALSAVLFAGVSIQTGSVATAGVVALGAGLLMGAINGALISLIRINPFVATLGTASIISGLAYIISGSSPFIVNNVPDFQYLALTRIAGITVPVWILTIVFVVASIVLAKTNFGRNVFAIGGNYEAAWLSGLRVKVLSASVYVLSGLLAALAGMMESSRLGVGQADMGAAMALDAIAIVVVGGTSLLGGEGAIWRSAVGLLILATLTNVFYSLNITQNWQLIAKGVIVVAAVSVDAIIRVRRR